MVFVFGRRKKNIFPLSPFAALIRNATKNQNFGNKSSPAASLKFYIVTKGNRPKMRFGHNFWLGGAEISFVAFFFTKLHIWFKKQRRNVENIFGPIWCVWDTNRQHLQFYDVISTSDDGTLFSCSLTEALFPLNEWTIQGHHTKIILQIIEDLPQTSLDSFKMNELGENSRLLS